MKTITELLNQAESDARNLFYKSALLIIIEVLRRWIREP